MNRFISFLILVTAQVTVLSQCLSDLSIQLEGSYQYPTFFSALTPVYDALERPYLYVASNEKGVHVFDVSGNQPMLVTTLDTNDLEMRPMSLTQRDSLLYVCVGGHFSSSTDPVGLVIVNVNDPTNPQVLDSWIAAGSGNGTGIVKIENDIAYLGAMGDGIVLLDVSDPNDIQFVNQFIPPVHFPITNDSAKVNARGMEVVNGIVYLCYDAGGFRIIDCTNPNAITEIGAYANPITYQPNEWPRAYNNVALVDDTLAYVAVDYCGIEVLNITDPSNITLVTHWNPHGCPTGLWWDAPIHANELIYKEECDLLFLASGKSELYVLNVSDPYSLDSCDSFGSIVDTTATWGLAIGPNEIYLSYVYVPTFLPSILVPFYSTWSGIKKLSYSYDCSTNNVQASDADVIQAFPNPASNRFFINGVKEFCTVFIYDMTGTLVLTEHLKEGYTELNIAHLSGGVYVCEIQGDSTNTILKILKE